MVEEARVVKAAELFAQDLYGYDDGILLGASVSLAYPDKKTPEGKQSKGSGIGNEYRGDFGYKDLEQSVYATIGQGVLEVGDIHGNINQDLDHIEEHDGIEIEPIHAYWAETNGDKNILQQMFEAPMNIIESNPIDFVKEMAFKALSEGQKLFTGLKELQQKLTNLLSSEDPELKEWAEARLEEVNNIIAEEEAIKEELVNKEQPPKFTPESGNIWFREVLGEPRAELEENLHNELMQNSRQYEVMLEHLMNDVEGSEVRHPSSIGGKALHYVGELYKQGKEGIREGFPLGAWVYDKSSEAISLIALTTIHGYGRIIFGDEGPAKIESAGQAISSKLTELDNWFGLTEEQKEGLDLGFDVIKIALGVKGVCDLKKYGELFGARHVEKLDFDKKIRTDTTNHKLQTDRDFAGRTVDLPPYGYKKYVLLAKTKEGKAPDFVRLFNDDLNMKNGWPSRRDGAWLMLRSDFEKDIKSGLTIEGIVQKYGLPSTPIKIVDAKLPGGVNIAVGKAGPIEFNFGEEVLKRTGGGRQYQILRKPDQDWFPEETIRGLDEYIKDIKGKK